MRDSNALGNCGFRRSSHCSDNPGSRIFDMDVGLIIPMKSRLSLPAAVFFINPFSFPRDMTFGLLKAHDLGMAPLDYPGLTEQYRRLGEFFEHTHNTVGFIFEKSALEAYVAHHKADPASAEGSGLENLANAMADPVATGDYKVFAVPYRGRRIHAIVDNYLLYVVYAKK
jgi:hypothetical protein